MSAPGTTPQDLCADAGPNSPRSPITRKTRGLLGRLTPEEFQHLYSYEGRIDCGPQDKGNRENDEDC